MKKNFILLTAAILMAAFFQTCGDEKDPIIDVTGVLLSTGASITMTVGDQIPLTATIQPVNATLKDITLTNSDPTVASITDWVLIAHKAGETTITASAGGKTFTCKVTVVDPAPAFVAVTDITGVPATAVVGTPLTLTGTVTPNNATNKTITWSVQSAGTTNATITDGNTLNATAAGTVTVRATVVNGATATTNYTKDFTITVSTTAAAFVAVTDITGIPSTAVVGTPLTLTGTVTPDNATNKTITWSVQSAGTTGATIAVGSNTLNATAAGTVTVRATVVNGLTATTNYTKDFTITVSTTAPTFVAVTNITGVPTTATVNTPLTLTGTVNPSDATNKTIAWSVASAGTTGATIAIGSNTLNTTAVGTVTVRATVVNGLTATTNYTKDFMITVSASTPTPTYSIEVTPARLSFGSLVEGYAQPDAQTVTITNNGTAEVTLNALPTVADYALSTLPTTSLAAGATATFTIRPNPGLAVGTYDRSFDVTGSNGVKATVSTAFTVSATATPTFQIDTHPSDVTVSYGGTATFSVVATGATSYQWQLCEDNGATWGNFDDGGVYSGSKTEKFSISDMNPLYMSWLFRCMVSNGTETLYSNAAKITVIYIHETGVTLDKSNITLDIGQTAELTATVNPSNADDKFVTWESDDPTVAKVNIDDGNFWVTTRKPVITAVRAGTATITATTYNGFTATCTVTVNPAKAITIGTQSGTMVEGVAGQTVTFPVTTTRIADGTYSVTFYVVSDDPPALQSKSITFNAGSGTLSLTSSISTLAGTYNLRIFHDGTESNEFTLTVDPAASTSTISLNRTTETHSYSSYMNTVYVTSNTSWTAVSDQSWVTFPSGSSGSAGTVLLRYNLALNTSTAPPSREAIIRVTTTDGSKEAELKITQTGYPTVLSVSPDTLNVPALWGVFSNVFNVTINNSGSWAVVNPDDYDWVVFYIDRGSNNNPIDLEVEPNTSPIERTATFIVEEARAGLITSKFTIKQAGAAACVAPTIDVGGQPKNQTVAERRPANFSVSASGTAPLTYQWYFDDNSGGGFVLLSHANSATLTLPSVTVAMNGYKYYCYITNACGNVTSNTVTVTVN